jgi:uncharacterized protein
MSGPEIQVSYVPERHRFEARIGGSDEVGVLDARRSRGVWTLSHTGVPPAIGGRGVGTALVRAALARVRAEGESVVPTCSFVQAYLRRHPEDADLLHEPYRHLLQGAPA